MFTNRLQQWQKSTKWLSFVNALTNTLMLAGLLFGIFLFAYLLKVWFFG